MEITSDIILRGHDWRRALEVFAPFFPQYLQPNYSIYVMSLSVGIMYDKQADMAGTESEEEKESRPSVPRTILHQHNSDLDFLFQSAILTSSKVNFSETERLKLAFDTTSDIKLNRLDFLTKFANFGVTKLLEHAEGEPVEIMENLKKFIASTIEGYNYEINGISDDDLDVDDIE